MSEVSPNNKSLALNDTDKTIIRIAAYTLGSAIIGSGLFFGIRTIVRHVRSNKEQTLSLNDDSTANYAKRLKMAFDNDGFWGTNVEQVRKVFSELPSKQAFTAVCKSYKNLYSANLIVDLTSELTSTEYYEMQNVLASKPDKTGEQKTFDDNEAATYAKRLNAAVNYKIGGFIPGTDEDAIRQALTEIPTKAAWEQVKTAYMKLYGVSVESDLDGDLGVFDFSWRDMIKTKP
ncbi:MAG TPA: hypothetical protein VN698_06150 [Bacteroidia bacterium]|nr:hypothetical protein [Bacteroidia bacterium]